MIINAIICVLSTVRRRKYFMRNDPIKMLRETDCLSLEFNCLRTGSSDEFDSGPSDSTKCKELVEQQTTAFS